MTNQSVSKWESGSCCPDIQLLPDIATYFGVSIDELLGYKPAKSFGEVYLRIKALFQETPAEESFDLAYKLSFLLHEGSISRGYKGYIPWDTKKDRTSNEDFYKWGFSACSEPEGVSVMKGNSVFVSSNKLAKPITASDIREVYNAIQPLSDKNTLQVLYGLYELTVNDFDLFVPPEMIAEKCKLPLDAVEAALDNLPIHLKTIENDEQGYRIEGSYMHIPSILVTTQAFPKM